VSKSCSPSEPIETSCGSSDAVCHDYGYGYGMCCFPVNKYAMVPGTNDNYYNNCDTMTGPFLGPLAQRCSISQPSCANSAATCIPVDPQAIRYGQLISPECDRDAGICCNPKQ